MCAEHLRGWLAAATSEDAPDATNWLKVKDLVQIQGESAGRVYHLSSCCPNSKRDWHLPGDRPRGGHLENSDGDFESLSRDGYHLPQRAP